MSPRKYQSVTVSVSLPQDLTYAIDRIADAENIPRSRIVRWACVSWLRKRNEREADMGVQRLGIGRDSKEGVKEKGRKSGYKEFKITLGEMRSVEPPLEAKARKEAGE